MGRGEIDKKPLGPFNLGGASEIASKKRLYRGLKKKADSFYGLLLLV